ncbi:hypothetical protein RclHR1_06870013 [Rhizophagus clarus]|uniref:Uncharacterized protein n=1 Tax=Rhizophagus clarus TaxID=94130 RepID=A0A2Z6SBA2_9GLOM|nr:hypothetical protein RclHR1_06870013 [Rhizophagus clarus]GES84812.1 hypothetical protein RCL_jg24160.t1 [Rhizophagus clarus]
MSVITTHSISSTRSRPLINNPIFPWAKIKLSEHYRNLFPRYGHSSCPISFKNELYFFGGISCEKVNNHVFLLDTDKYNVQIVKTTGNIPSPRSGHTHIRVGSNLIVFGGKLENIEEKPDYNLYVLNIGTKEWTKPSIKGVTPLGRHGHTSVLVGSMMYVFGGCIDGCYLNDLVAFDTKFLDFNEGSWEFIDPIGESPPGRSGHISCAYKGRIYIFGGTDGEKCFNDIWYYDIETREWVELICDTFAPIPRESHGAALANDVIYIFGGRTRDGKELADLAAYGINNGRWYMFQKMGPSPGPRYWLTVSSSKNIVMVFGGAATNSTKPDEDGIIHILDTSKIKYPIDADPPNQSQLQMVLSTFPQKKPLPKLRQPPLTNNEREITFENFNNKIELKARNPDIKLPSSRTSSRPASRNFSNVDITLMPPPVIPSSSSITTTTTPTPPPRGKSGGNKRHSKNLEKDNNSDNSRPSSIIESKKSSNTNEKVKKKNNPKKDISSEKAINNNILDNNKKENEKKEEISLENQSVDIKQKGKAYSLQVDTENEDETPESTKVLKIFSAEKSHLQRQNSVDTIRSVRSLSSPSLRPKGARTLEKKSKVKLANDNSSSSTSSVNPSQSEPQISTNEEITSIKLEEPITVRLEEPISVKSEEPTLEETISTKSQEATVTLVKSQEEVISTKSQEGITPIKSKEEVISTKSQEQEATLAKSQEGITSAKSKEEVISTKSQEREVTSAKPQEKATSTKPQEKVASAKSQKVASTKSQGKVTKSQERVTSKSHEKTTTKSKGKVTSVKSQEKVVSAKSKERATSAKSREEVSSSSTKSQIPLTGPQEKTILTKSQEIAMVKSQEEITKIKLQEEEIITAKSFEEAEISSDKSQEIATNESQEIATNESQEIATNESQEIATDDSQEIATDDSQEVATDDSQEVATDDSQEVATVKSQEIATDESQEISSDKSQEIATVKSQEISSSTPQEIPSVKVEEIPASSSTIQVVPPEQIASKPPPVRPPRRRLHSEPLTVNTKQSEQNKIKHIEEKDLATPSSISSKSYERKISITSSEGGPYPMNQLSSLERENFLERLSDADFRISELRKREKLYQAEIDLARKAGYIPTFNFNNDNNEDFENVIDINEFIDIGEPGSEKFKVIEAIIKLSQQLQKAKETIAYQERVAAQKISDFERLYTASLEETAYFKAKFAALMNEYETERLARTAIDVEEIKQQLNEKTQKLERTSKEVEEAKNKVEFIREVISDSLDPDEKGIISSRFKEIVARCDELEALHEIAHKELKASLTKYKETVRYAQGTISKNNSAKGLENKLKSVESTTVKSQEQLNDIKNRLSQVEEDYQKAVVCTSDAEQKLNQMKEELIQSKAEMDNLNEKLMYVVNHNEILENRLKELQNSMNSHSNIRNSILQEYANQQLEEQQINYEKEKELFHQKIQDLQTQINLAQDEKSLMDQGYEALRRIYESLRKQNEILKKSNEMLLKRSLESGLKDKKNELINKSGEIEQDDEVKGGEKEGEKGKDKEGENLAEENLTIDENQGEVKKQEWEQERKMLEQEISKVIESNENLEKNNLVLKKNVNESENKIATLLDQMENAVDTYRGIEDNIREGSPALVGPIIRNKVSSGSLKEE